VTELILYRNTCNETLAQRFGPCAKQNLCARLLTVLLVVLFPNGAYRHAGANEKHHHHKGDEGVSHQSIRAVNRFVYFSSYDEAAEVA
jgi:hypothetical protein